MNKGLNSTQSKPWELNIFIESDFPPGLDQVKLNTSHENTPMSSMKPLKLSSIEESCAQSMKSAPSLVLFENLLNTPIQAVEVGWSLVGVSPTVFSTNPASPSELSEAACKTGFWIRTAREKAGKGRNCFVTC